MPSLNHARRRHSSRGWACTYLVANNGEAVLIDPVYDYIKHYETVLAERGLNLAHAWQHTRMPITSPLALLSKDRSIPFYMWKDTASLGVTDYIDEDSSITIAGVEYTFLHVPGHTRKIL